MINLFRLPRARWAEMTTPLPPGHADRLARAKLAVEGLSVGDALGQTCFHPDNSAALLDDPRATARAPWEYTDDTEMALAIVEVLTAHGRINQDALAHAFARRFELMPFRGYGGGAIRLLGAIAGGADWRAAAESLFGGGSFGNGSAMRAAPVGAYFSCAGYERVAEEARLASAVTHAHPEGIAGGIAAAVAAAYAWLNRERRADDAVKRGLFDAVLAHTSAGEVRAGIEQAARLAFDTSLETVVQELGNGSRVICQDTVPFCLWVAARHLDDYQTGLVNTIRAGGDIDTNAAIVGGIVGLAVGEEGIPRDWRDGREDLKW